MRFAGAALVWTCGFVFLGVAATACSSTCTDREQRDDPIRYTKGHTNSDASFYESSGWHGPFLHFPPGRRYDFAHGLSAAPSVVNIYAAFSESGVEGNVAPASGNQALIEEVTPSIVRIGNDTCSEIFIRVTASTARPAPDADGG